MGKAFNLQNYLDKNGKIKVFPSKRSNKIQILIYLASKFETGITYTEKEINEIIDRNHSFNDICLLRRELYNHKFLNRLNDSSKYWKEEKQPTIEELMI